MIGYSILILSTALALSSFFYIPPVPRWFEKSARKIAAFLTRNT